MTKGDKAPMASVTLARWDPDLKHDLDRGQAYVVQPLTGARTYRVRVYHPSRKFRDGKVTFGKLGRLARDPDNFVRRFIEPPCLARALGNESLEGWWYAVRFFWGYDVAQATYIPMGGLWTAREGEPVLHGTPDALFGPATF